MKKCIPLIACIIFVLLAGTFASIMAKASSLNANFVAPTELTEILSGIADAAQGVGDLIGGIDKDEIGDAFSNMIGGIGDRFKKDPPSEAQTSDFETNKNAQESNPIAGNNGNFSFVLNKTSQTAPVSSSDYGTQKEKPDDNTALQSSFDNDGNNESSKRDKQIALKRGLVISSCVVLVISSCVILFMLLKRTKKKVEYIDDKEFFGDADEN